MRVNLRVRNFYPLFFGMMIVFFIAIIVGIIKRSGYHVVYSATASMPWGFYFVSPIKNITRYDIVEFIPPIAILNFVKEHHWIPQSGLMIKYVFAVPGDEVCVRDAAVWINNKKIGKVYRFYAHGQLLPQSKICGRLRSDQYFVLSTKKERSFDGRYFGAISVSNILGRAIPIYTTLK